VVPIGGRTREVGVEEEEEEDSSIIDDKKS
jgi:hypothetical protein